MRLYDGFWERENLLPGVLRMQEAFKPHPGDIIVVSSLKSGTTWLKALVFTIVQRDKYNFSDHPLLKFSPHDCVRQLEEICAFHDEQFLQSLSDPRVLATHTTYRTLPESVKASKCPIIYICREPKDIPVSWWQMSCMFRKDHMLEPVPFAQFCESFCIGEVPNGPIWDHVLEYYMKSLQDPNKVLFLKYEEMMSNPINGVIRIANFVGIPFSEVEVKKGVLEEIVQFCSFRKMKDLDVSKNIGVEGPKNHYFFRKGLVGDWQNHMTAEMATKLDEIIRQIARFRFYLLMIGSGLSARLLF